jgi:hypothetical protein
MSSTDSLDDRIRELCALAISAEDSELESILFELKAIVHERIERLRSTAAAVSNRDYL